MYRLGLYILDKFYALLTDSVVEEAKATEEQVATKKQKRDCPTGAGARSACGGDKGLCGLLKRLVGYYGQTTFETTNYCRYLIRFFAFLTLSENLLLEKEKEKGDENGKGKYNYEKKGLAAFLTTPLMTGELSMLRQIYNQKPTSTSSGNSNINSSGNVAEMMGLARLELLKDKESTQGPLLYAHILMDLLCSDPQNDVAVILDAAKSDSDSDGKSQFSQWKQLFLKDFHDNY